MASALRAAAVDELLQAAQQGDGSALSKLFAVSRQYLSPLARSRVTQRLRGKADASDLVQATMLEAHRHFLQFRGTTEPEFAAWLRRILTGLAANEVRRFFGTKQRDARLERAINVEMSNASCTIGRQIAAVNSSPSEHVIKREATSRLVEALDQLPAHYRQVIVLRHLKGLAFSEVAERMGRSIDSVEKLWVRALRRLRETLGANV